MHRLLRSTVSPIRFCGVLWVFFVCANEDVVWAEPPPPEVIELSGETPDKSILCSVYRPDPLPEQGKGGLLIHLYGHNGSHLDYNASADSYKRFRQQLSERGFWLVIPDLGPRHWMNKAAVENVDRVIEQMTEKQSIDKDQVHLLGTSMGGGGSLVYVTRRPGKIRSVVSVFPMTDYVKWEKELNGNYSRGIVTAHGVDFDKREELFRELSPTGHIDAFEKTSVYLLHGASDNICPLSHSQEFAKLMSEKKYAVILKEVPGIGHTDAIMEDYQDEVADFLTGRK